MDFVDASWLIPPLIMAVGIGIGYSIHRVLMRAQSASDQKRATRALEDARSEAQHILKDAELRARDEMVRSRETVEHEHAARISALNDLEGRLEDRSAALESRAALLEKREAAVSARYEAAENAHQAALNLKNELQRQRETLQISMERVSGISSAEARTQLLEQVRSDIQPEAEQLQRKIVNEARETAEMRAREIMVGAMERYAAPQVTQATTAVVPLPGEEMKGRLIGKEGRNFRSLENALGCNIVIDDTPQAVMVSCFDPMRREIARQTLLRLVEDGRIHPPRIEEVAATVRAEIEEDARLSGEKTLQELKLSTPPEGIVRALGRLKYRHSYAQNVLSHSVEVAHLMGMMAVELGLDPDIAKRVGLFHDLGKAMDHQEEGSHAGIGARLLEENGENPLVVEAVAAHHRETDFTNVYASLASAADAMTAARPGARMESTESYIHRLEKMEALTNAFPGVAGSYAVQAGRELRVLVQSAQVDDAGMHALAQSIARAIEEKLKFPGQIKITVIRETRCVEYAR